MLKLMPQALLEAHAVVTTSRAKSPEGDFCTPVQTCWVPPTIATAWPLWKAHFCQGLDLLQVAVVTSYTAVLVVVACMHFSVATFCGSHPVVGEAG
ncbi:hypothetical protein [Streptomyces sp. NPDC020983]|uniref:hypothetical protein n=1 Tax=Streptomyces sp. NPDC020983 TaxID=3365106 RepID=UPI0037971C9B